MGALNEFLQTKGIYTLVMILFFLGVYGMVLSKNYMKKADGDERHAGCCYFLLPVPGTKGRRYDSDF